MLKATVTLPDKGRQGFGDSRPFIADGWCPSLMSEPWREGVGHRLDGGVFWGRCQCWAGGGDGNRRPDD